MAHFLIFLTSCVQISVLYCRPELIVCELLISQFKQSFTNEWAAKGLTDILAHTYFLLTSEKTRHSFHSLSVLARVTRLGKFSHLGQMFSFGHFFENCRYSAICWVTFFHGKSYVYVFFYKNRLGEFLQTRLVTLVLGCTGYYEMYVVYCPACSFQILCKIFRAYGFILKVYKVSRRYWLHIKESLTFGCSNRFDKFDVFKARLKQSEGPPLRVNVSKVMGHQQWLCRC
jgi:hypothetical protein